MAGDVFPPAYRSEDPALKKIAAVRALIPDVEQLPNSQNWEAPDEYMFSDDQIAAYLEIAGGSTLRASAFALEALGASEAIISKVISTEDLSTNGAALLNGFTQQARYRHSQADKAEEAADVEESVIVTPFQPYPLHYEAY